MSNPNEIGKPTTTEMLLGISGPVGAELNLFDQLSENDPWVATIKDEFINFATVTRVAARCRSVDGGCLVCEGMDIDLMDRTTPARICNGRFIALVIALFVICSIPSRAQTGEGCKSAETEFNDDPDARNYLLEFAPR